MTTLKFDIQHAHGPRESVIVEGARAWIGSAAHCEVRLPIDQAAPEHVLVELQGGGAQLHVHADAEAPRVNELPLSAADLVPGSVLQIGQVRLAVSWAEDDRTGPNPESTARSNREVLFALGLVLLFLVLGFGMLSERATPLEQAPNTYPPLFAAPAASCPDVDPGRARARGEEYLAVADTKRERMPFAIDEGVAAVGRYETASACFRVGAIEGRAREAQQSADALKEQLSNEFRARRLRLSHLLRVQDRELAAEDVRALRQLLRAHQGPYVDWLEAVSRQLESRSEE
ncbi:MAG TPA: hypothetical protein VFQ61_13920 [Polyangiaceae bacterium]|nr:hypothetical protein [Polyangiaceae bacterium]